MSLASDDHPNARRLTALVLALSVLCLDGGVKFPQLLPQTFRVGDDGGQRDSSCDMWKYLERREQENRGTPVYSDCRFVGNFDDYGGAIVDRVGVRSAISGCVFENNRARWRAGAIDLDYGSRPTLTDCRFTGNRSDCHGGALAAVSRASQLEATIAVFKSGTFVGNHAQRLGGAIADFDNSIFGLASGRLRPPTALGPPAGNNLPRWMLRSARLARMAKPGHG